MYTLVTPYTDEIWPILRSAAVPAWERHLIRIEPEKLFFLQGSGERRKRHVTISDEDCVYRPHWEGEAGPSWLSFTPQSGGYSTPVTVTVDSANLAPGLYTGTITIYTIATSRTMAIKLLVVEKVYRTYLPILLKGK